jgi:hypothetical protein
MTQSTQRSAHQSTVQYTADMLQPAAAFAVKENIRDQMYSAFDAATGGKKAFNPGL